MFGGCWGFRKSRMGNLSRPTPLSLKCRWHAKPHARHDPLPYSVQLYGIRRTDEPKSFLSVMTHVPSKALLWLGWTIKDRSSEHSGIQQTLSHTRNARAVLRKSTGSPYGHSNYDWYGGRMYCFCPRLVQGFKNPKTVSTMS